MNQQRDAPRDLHPAKVINQIRIAGSCLRALFFFYSQKIVVYARKQANCEPPPTPGNCTAEPTIVKREHQQRITESERTQPARRGCARSIHRSGATPTQWSPEDRTASAQLAPGTNGLPRPRRKPQDDSGELCAAKPRRGRAQPVQSPFEQRGTV